MKTTCYTFFAFCSIFLISSCECTDDTILLWGDLAVTTLEKTSHGFSAGDLFVVKCVISNIAQEVTDCDTYEDITPEATDNTKGTLEYRYSPVYSQDPDHYDLLEVGTFDIEALAPGEIIPNERMEFWTDKGAGYYLIRVVLNTANTQVNESDYSNNEGVLIEYFN